MPDLSFLPTLNAGLNVSVTVCLIAGYKAIRSKHVTVHKFLMTSAVVLSIVFLASYLTYHSIHGATPYEKTGWIRVLYFSILISHMVLAAAILPLVGITFYKAIRGQIERHRKLARITLPLWLYVSVTGVIVYVMLYYSFLN